MIAKQRAECIARTAAKKLDTLDILLKRHHENRAIIFTANNDFAYEISQEFIVSCITHQIATDERTEILERFRTGEYSLLVTSQILDEGIDVPAAIVGIILSGSASKRQYSQRLGRILRPTDDRRPARLYEIIAADTMESSTPNRIQALKEAPKYTEPMAARVTLPNSTDIVVIGGGIMGTSTAFFLSQQTDLDITLVEKDGIATGSTGDSSAILRHHYGDETIYSKMAWWSHEFYRNFEEETGEVIAHVDNPLVRFGRDNTDPGTYAEAGYETLRTLDIPVTRYDSEELPANFPMIADVESFDFGISDDAAGFSDGADAANGFARAAQQNGATVVTGASVEAIRVEEDSVVGVTTDDGDVDCKTVVLAAGSWTPRLGADVGVEIPITTTREQILILEPAEAYKEEYPSLVPTTALPGGEWYIRPDFGDSILVATHHTDDEVNPDHYDSTPGEETILKLTEQLSDMIPELSSAGLHGQYCGIYSTTPDHDFILDQAGPDGCYFACGFSGHGFKHGPAVGKIMTDLIVDGSTDMVDAEFFSLERFEDSPHGHGKAADDV